MTESKPVRVSILDKEYLISCPDDEREQLYAVVDFVNEKLLEVKGSGNVIGTERIVIMATLNIANELLAYKRKNKDYTESVDSIVKRLQTKIDGVLVGNE
ncbi:MAG: cell division protein ZapA [Gammaproteobacteria bacterium]|nr:cell division protein ZapA [Gammaproteobacteria bacterium]MDE0511724.1 cell division protein ZapA [Gammaproteobacteria bacterium]